MKHGHRIRAARYRNKIRKVFLDAYISHECVFKAMRKHPHQAFFAHDILLVLVLCRLLSALVAGILNRRRWFYGFLLLFNLFLHFDLFDFLFLILISWIVIIATTSAKLGHDVSKLFLIYEELLIIILNFLLPLLFFDHHNFFILSN